ncbi:FAD/NAD(P)-binding domain-containing protein [Linnemannia elongata AG-77]|uniref:FAD/NAD(P)-binding domain-containing protein n=1 Tax=Linnemannia elongata AG-77 TaxID=1314771 RepID=A0A197KKR4_9FUNG|nr:FAD/NAD(P)-binding domain-containing protein [Linnemannia elongata AG-77]
MTNNNTTHRKPPVTSGDSDRPKVLIVGAGLAGLTLGMILQNSDIPYEIFESTPAIRPVGAAMVFGPTLAPMMKQCGIYDEFVTLGKRNETINVLNSNGGKEYSVDFSTGKEMFGEDGYILTRPVIYDLIFRQIPKDRIHLGKKIVSTDQNSDCVMIRCSDGVEYKGDILVGADGAYSATRKLDATEFPDLAKEPCQFFSTLGDNNPYASSTFTTAQGTVAWGVIVYLPGDATREDKDYRSTDWGPEAAVAFCEKVRDLPVKSGGDKIVTIGDLIDVTPKEQINKVRLEEKTFETWHHGRIVLMGDACHKFTPAGGVGATNAMHDAIVLANWIHALPNNATAKEINQAFQMYQDERFPWVLEAFKHSRAFQVTNSKGFLGKMMRFAARHMPTWMQQKTAISMNINRPQVGFLDQAEDNGSVRPAPQISLQAQIPRLNQDSREATLAM